MNPETGQSRRKQKWVTGRGSRREAEAKLADLLHDANRGQFVEPTKLTLQEWLTDWLEKAIKPPAKRLRTYETYRSVMEGHLKPSLGGIRLQQLKAADLKRYYTEAKVCPSTLAQHHTILHSALKAAMLEGLVQRNVAALVVGKPRRKEGQDDVLENCWEAHEAKQFLETAKAKGPQAAAFYALALDSGARKAELCGFKWPDLNLESGKVSVLRQLVKPGPTPIFGPPKNGTPRTIDIAPETVALLRKHKANQAQLKLANRSAYHDHGLMFANECGTSAREEPPR